MSAASPPGRSHSDAPTATALEPEPEEQPWWTVDRLKANTALGSGGNRDKALQRVLDGAHIGRWSVGAMLGFGSSGVVIQCADKRLGQVAIKFICSREPDPLRREVAFMQRVAHPNVCRYIEQCTLGGGLFAVILELLDISLAQLVERAPNGQLPEADVTQMSLQILAALQHMHEQQVIHRDVP
jgi:serine/threonine protein kinase